MEENQTMVRIPSMVRISTTVNHTDSQRTLEQLEKDKESIYGIVETWRKYALSSTFHEKSGMGKAK